VIDDPVQHPTELDKRSKWPLSIFNDISAIGLHSQHVKAAAYQRSFLLRLKGIYLQHVPNQFPATLTFIKDRGRSPGRLFSCFAVRTWLLNGSLFHAAKLAYLAAAMLCSAAESSHAQAQNVPAAETCLTANLDLSLRARLPRTAARLKSKEPLKIVAIGSSSTVGLWTLRSADTYPEVMRRELSSLTSNPGILVINSGRVADTIPGNVARFERDVLSYKPDLVVW
jgi:hypothetical protein